MPVPPIAAVLRWFRRTAARLGLAERLAAAAAPQEPEPLLQLRRRQVVPCSTSAAEKETQ